MLTLGLSQELKNPHHPYRYWYVETDGKVSADELVAFAAQLRQLGPDARLHFDGMEFEISVEAPSDSTNPDISFTELSDEAQRLYDSLARQAKALCAKVRPRMLPIVEHMLALPDQATREAYIAEVFGDTLHKGALLSLLAMGIVGDDVSMPAIMLAGAVQNQPQKSGASLVGRHTVEGNFHIAETMEDCLWHSQTCPSCTTGQTIPRLKDNSSQT